MTPGDIPTVGGILTNKIIRDIVRPMMDDN